MGIAARAKAKAFAMMAQVLRENPANQQDDD